MNGGKTTPFTSVDGAPLKGIGGKTTEHLLDERKEYLKIL
jgi:hypothetical protein